LKTIGINISKNAVKGYIHYPDSPEIIQKIWLQRD
jgi:hypothetical protein